VVSPQLEVCHGSPLDEDAYIVDSADARDAFAVARAPVCCFGHTHLAVVFERAADRIAVRVPHSPGPLVVALDPGRRYLVNPGSVGQPRDGDPRAAFAILDEAAARVELGRVEYPVDEAQAAILAAGLPPLLAHRLAAGR
jgi:diadenosine tetraphosphatase ApaH/serine/threonine PP2A family protein phosphatase